MTFPKFGGTAREVCAEATGFNDSDLDAERCRFARKHLGEAFDGGFSEVISEGSGGFASAGDLGGGVLAKMCSAVHNGLDRLQEAFNLILRTQTLYSHSLCLSFQLLRGISSDH